MEKSIKTWTGECTVKLLHNKSKMLFIVLFFFCLQVGNHIDVQSGEWTSLDAGIGAGIDSYFEYLLKGGILFGSPKLIDMFRGEG